MPCGEVAFNCLGLTSQNTVHAVYLTSGPNPRLHFGSLIVELRHAPRWQLAAPGVKYTTKSENFTNPGKRKMAMVKKSFSVTDQQNS